MELKINEKIEDLDYNGLKIIQSDDNFKFGIDAVILANYAKKGLNKAKVLDIGTGTGIISIILAGKTNLESIIGLEIQEEMCDMAKRSVKLNNLEKRIEIINDDVKNIENIIEKNSVDVVVTNPPYQKYNTGIKNENKAEMIARHEVLCTLLDICKAVKYVLKPLGKFYIIHRPERIADIICDLRDNGLEPKEIVFISPYINAKPNMVLVKAVKGAKPFLKVLKPITVYDESGNYTKEILELYGKK